MKSTHLSIAYLLILMLLASCSIDNSLSSPHLPMEEIKGRDGNGPRLPIYRVRVPKEWIRRDPLPDESIVDTTKALCEFIILENGETVRIAIHNFPSTALDQRIPPEAQIARWQRQFDPLYINLSQTLPKAFSGYSGLFFSGVGMIDQVETMILGWALQLAPEHYRTLASSITSSNAASTRQMQADVTIKATGIRALVEKHQNAIIAFAHSFELIQAIPPHP